jgi:nitrite reductase/ring-hydroxylating ferredoxin subunit
MGLRSRLKDGLRRLVIGSASEPHAAPAGPSSIRAEEGWVPICPAIAIQEGKPRQFLAHGRTVAAFRVGADVFVVDNACLHEDGPLGEGRQVGAVVTCPYHDRRYDVRTGACLTEPARRLATCPVRTRDGWVLVGRPTPGTEERGGDHADGLATS